MPFGLVFGEECVTSPKSICIRGRNVHLLCELIIEIHRTIYLQLSSLWCGADYKQFMRRHNIKQIFKYFIICNHKFSALSSNKSWKFVASSRSKITPDYEIFLKNSKDFVCEHCAQNDRCTARMEKLSALSSVLLDRVNCFLECKQP